MMTELLPWLIQTTLATSLLMVAVLCLRRPVARLAGPQWAYLLWLAPALRFLTALIPESSLSQWVVLDSSYVLLAPDGLTETVAQQYSPVVVFLVGGWLVGAAWRLVHEWVVHLRFRAQLLDHSRKATSPMRRQVVECAQALGIHPAPEIRIALCRHGPALIGVINPILYLPDDFYQCYSVRQRQLILHHELTHLSRRDLLWNILAAALRCVFWYNPLLRYCERHFRADQELACDHSVVAHENRSARKLYGQALLAASRSRVSAGTASFLDDGALVKRRMRFLRYHSHRFLPSTIGLAILCLTLLWGSTLGVAPTQFVVSSLIPTLIAPGPVLAISGCG